MITLEIFPSSEFIHHFHLVLTHLWSDIKKPGFLFILSKINNTCPVLIILSFETLQEIIERFIFTCHISDLWIKWLTFTVFMAFNKILEFFHLLNTPWSRQICKWFTLFSFFVLEEKHLSLLILVLIGIICVRVVHLVAIKWGEFHHLRRVYRAHGHTISDALDQHVIYICDW